MPVEEAISRLVRLDTIPIHLKTGVNSSRTERGLPGLNSIFSMSISNL